MATGIVSVDLSSAGHETLSRILLAIAGAFWLPLVAPVLRHRVTPTVRVSFMLAVSAESIAVPAATLAGALDAPGLAYAGLAPFVLGLGAYAFVLVRFDSRQLLAGRGVQLRGRAAVHSDALHDSAQAWTWVAAAAWVVTFIAMLRRNHPKRMRCGPSRR
jgi:hypothetical protein